MAALAKQRYTLEEYLARERAAEQKSEFLGGEIFAMAGTSFAHNVIVVNLIGELRTRLNGGPCQPVGSDQRVRVRETELNTYPDVTVVCGEPEFTDDFLDTLTNPTVIFEVLSPSTEGYDRGEKFAHYRRIASLQEYVLLAQDKRRVERFTRQGDLWLLTEVSAPAAGSHAALSLESLGCALPLDTLYARVPLPSPDEAARLR